MQTKDLLTVPEAARLLRCSERTIYRYLANGTLPIYTVGDGRVRYTSKRAAVALRKPRRKVAA